MPLFENSKGLRRGGKGLPEGLVVRQTAEGRRPHQAQPFGCLGRRPAVGNKGVRIPGMMASRNVVIASNCPGSN